jgi:hypothetical protein
MGSNIMRTRKAVVVIMWFILGIILIIENYSTTLLSITIPSYIIGDTLLVGAGLLLFSINYNKPAIALAYVPFVIYVATEYNELSAGAFTVHGFTLVLILVDYIFELGKTHWKQQI